MNMTVDDAMIRSIKWDYIKNTFLTNIHFEAARRCINLNNPTNIIIKLFVRLFTPYI
ncbi:hypothetical protein VCRA2121O157_160052 [Vibrio crassostreae]|nr:hypothetical protein VCRA2113O138_150062 [Vibrio crassostreae]CAK1789109.1 hypothetical protein VCRA2113O140_160053 [Vibrio crassostreae]CAK1840072.1 hypothetical protein VCRA2113O137_190051 [Vibrio crassostreae]CAK2273432.1 hypothetical protein VCRA2116O141_150062 [Vibrio crassostreae]CAK2644420.1 hypothetical protein VCRA2119O148_150062 [Vibrio crassostreae]